MKRIALIVETSLASGRHIVAGVSRFLDEQNDWTVFQPSGPLGTMDLNALAQWNGDGIIARIANPQLLQLIADKNVPTVDVLGNMTPHKYPLVKCDDVGIGQTVAQHFLRNGHRHFGFIGLIDERWSIEREQGFGDAVREHGHLHRFHVDQQTQSPAQKDYLKPIKAWLGALPSPLAVMVASDQLAPLLFEAAHQLRRSIPESVSVVGVDNDAPFCQLCRPRLSSVEPNHEQVGYKAAKILQQLISKGSLKESLTEIRDPSLHIRLSSELVAIEDSALLKAIDHIRKHASTGTNTDEVARAAGLSRSVLQRRIRRQINQSVGELILSEKLRTAREMLSHTKLPLNLVAERSGFNCQEYMNQVFKKHLETTPRRYRVKQSKLSLGRSFQ
jgi:LacI family transcriptional regulator